MRTTGVFLSSLTPLAAAHDVASFAARTAPAFFALLGVGAGRTAQDTAREVRAPEGPGELSLLDASGDLVVFPIRRRPGSALAFVGIGRDETSDVRLLDASVSRFHACVRADDTGAFVLLEDVGSRHGTFLDGERLLRRAHGSVHPTGALRSGRHLRIGRVSLAYLDAAEVHRLALPAPIAAHAM